MAKTYVTFGQIHVHRINGKTFDCNCVAVINHEGNEEDGKKLAFAYFVDKWHNSYYNKVPDMQWYPRGLIEVN